jgi:hypothetical protein
VQIIKSKQTVDHFASVPAIRRYTECCENQWSLWTNQLKSDLNDCERRSDCIEIPWDISEILAILQNNFIK